MKGVYDVAPGLRPLEGPLANADSDAPKFLRNKKKALAERYEKYVQRFETEPEFESAAASRLCRELGIMEMANLDDVALEIQPDIALVRRRPDGTDYVAYLHLCAPSHWGAEEKIGRSFFEVHTPVPHFDRVNAVAPKLVEAMIHGRPMERYVWTLESDAYLNHHPVPAPGHDPRLWYGRNFENGPTHIRTERQTMFGMPELEAAFFLIHVYIEPLEALTDEERRALDLAVASMSPESRHYKGLGEGPV